MSLLTSSPVNLIVSAPVTPDARFADGADPGRFDQNVWYPGRSPDGRVNVASWDLVPRGRWVQVDGTRFDSLTNQVVGVVPGWTVDNATFRTIFQSWSGFALDLDGCRAWFLGGGHSNGHNNGLYRFDLFRMRWAVEHLPSDRTTWASNYNPLSATPYPDSHAAAEAKFAAGTLQPVNDLFYDELPDGRPTARHTYSSMAYIPETQEIVMMCRRLWRYSLNGRQWNYKRLIRDQYPIWMDGEDIIATYDEKTGELLASSSGSNALYRSTGYDLFANKWTDWSDSPWRRTYGVADVRHGRLLGCMAPPLRTDNGVGVAGRYWLHDLDQRRTVQQGELALLNGLTRGDFMPNMAFYDASAVTYIPVLNRYWMCTLMFDRRMAFFEIDPTVTPWTMKRLDFPAGAPSPSRLLKRRFNFWPALNAVTLADNGDTNLHLYRF